MSSRRLFAFLTIVVCPALASAINATNSTISSESSGGSTLVCCCLPILGIGLAAILVMVLKDSKHAKISNAKVRLQNKLDSYPTYSVENGRLVSAEFNNIAFKEERAIRKWISGGPRFRVARGVSFALNQGHSESHGELRTIDSGTIRVSQNNLVFTGSLKNMTFLKKNITSITAVSPTEVSIGVTNRQKIAYFAGAPSDIMVVASWGITDSPTSEELKKEAAETLLSNIDSISNFTLGIKEGDTLQMSELEGYIACIDLVIQIFGKHMGFYQYLVKKESLKEAETRVRAYKAYRNKLSDLLARSKAEGITQVSLPQQTN
jgi:hypothetical protein